MIIRHHLIFAAAVSIALSLAYFPESLVFSFQSAFTQAFAYTAGTLVGVIIPDIHIKKPVKAKELIIPYYIIRLARCFLLPPALQVLRLCNRGSFEKNDKRITHSLFGIISAAILLYLYAYAVSLIICILPQINAASIAFCTQTVFCVYFGLITGILLHAAEDVCTKKGLFLFFPFCNTNISGCIRPCKDTKRIIAYASGYIALMLAVIILTASGITKESGIESYVQTAVPILIILITLLTFAVSDIHIVAGK